MDEIIVGSHNMLFRLDEKKWLSDLKKSSQAHLLGLQEAIDAPQRAALKKFCEQNGRGLFHPEKCGNAITWDEDTYFTLGVEGKIQPNLSAATMGVKAKWNPPRDFTYVGLQHIKSSQKHLLINLHSVQGATKLESAPDNKDSDELSIYKDWAAGQYWLDIMSFVAKEMSHNKSAKSMDPFWDAIFLVGDFNAFLDRKERWYYPGALLPALFTADDKPKGLDHILSTHMSDIQWTKRWGVKGYTDHLINFRKGTLKEVADYPRQK